MELTWQSIRKSMDTQIDYTHMGIKACIENDQKGNGCVPGPRATMHYQEIRLVRNNEHKICHSYEQTRLAPPIARMAPHSNSFLF